MFSGNSPVFMCHSLSYSKRFWSWDSQNLVGGLCTVVFNPGNNAGLFFSSFSGVEGRGRVAVSLTQLHISRRTNLISILLYTIVILLYTIYFESEKMLTHLLQADVISSFVTMKYQKSEKPLKIDENS